MLELRLLSLTVALAIVIGAPLDEDIEACPNVPAEHIQLDQIYGPWRLAYLFLARPDQGLNEDNTCFVVDFKSVNQTLEISCFIDAVNDNRIERATMTIPVSLLSPSEWKVHMLLASSEYIHTKIIRASEEHLVLTFCGPNSDLDENNVIDSGKMNEEDPIDWRSLFQAATRRRRSTGQHGYRKTKEGPHMWTAILVKHNDISALKFVEYAAILMKHGFDVTQGELVSFGKCPVSNNVKKQH